MPPLMPTLFLSHGSPDLLLSRHPSRQLLQGLAARLPKPRGIVVASAHWLSDPVAITGAGALATLYDFSGFPAALSAQDYAAHGDSGLSAVVEQLLAVAGIACRRDGERGLDHGAWVPLRMLYPAADIPVLQIALPRGLQACARLGEALAPLAQQGILLIGSGGSVHNLRALKRQGPVDPWAQAFAAWLRANIEGNAFERVLAPAQFSDQFRLAHPSVEHYAPLPLAWAAGDCQRPGRCFAEGFMHGNLGMDCYVFGAVDALQPASA